MFNKINQVFSENYLVATKTLSFRFYILLCLLVLIGLVTSLTFLSGYFDNNKYKDFYTIAGGLIVALMQLITGMVAFFFGEESGKKQEQNNNNQYVKYI